LTTISRAVLSANLRYFRQQQGWSQEALAAQCGLHRTYIGAVERGERNISLDNPDRLAAALGVTLGALLEIPCRPDHVRETPGDYRAHTSATDYNVFTASCYL
jgi:transcriptional regulator with XRE-family HTH domain